MRIIALLLVAIVALSHVGFLVLEMFFWNDPVGQGIFGTTPEFAEASKVLAANQGLYNGFLAAGLLWGLLSGRRDVKTFFLACVIIAASMAGSPPRCRSSTSRPRRHWRRCWPCWRHRRRACGIGFDSSGPPASRRFMMMKPARRRRSGRL